MAGQPFLTVLAVGERPDLRNDGRQGRRLPRDSRPVERREFLAEYVKARAVHGRMMEDDQQNCFVR